MEDFLKKYGFDNEGKFVEHFKSDSVFAVKVLSDLLSEKFPDEFPKKAPVEKAPVVEPVSKKK